MEKVRKNILNILKESEENQEKAGGLTIAQYAKFVFGGEMDCDVCDKDIDMLVAMVYDVNHESSDEMSKFLDILANNVKIVKAHPSSYGDVLECDFSSFFKPYNEQLKEFFDMSRSEFDDDEAYYEAVVNLEPLISGNASEQTYKELNNILTNKQSKPEVSQNNSGDNMNESTQKMSYDEFLNSEWLKDYLKIEFKTSGYNEWSEFINNFDYLRESADLTAEVIYHDEDGTREYIAGKLSDGRYFLIGQQEQIVVSDKDLPSLAKKDMDDFNYDEDGDKDFIEAIENGTTLDKNSDIAKIIINASRNYLDDGSYLLSESEDAARDLGIEPGSDEEAQLNSLYDEKKIEWTDLAGSDQTAVEHFLSIFGKDFTGKSWNDVESDIRVACHDIGYANEELINSGYWMEGDIDPEPNEKIVIDYIFQNYFLPKEKSENLNESVDVNNLTKEQLWKLRQEIVLGSLYTHDYDNSFGIDPSAVYNFFDSFIEDAQMDDYGKPNNRNTEEYDNAEDLYNYYKSCENPFGEVENINESTELNINDIDIDEPNSMETIRKYVSAQEQHKGTSIRFDSFNDGHYVYDLRIYVGGLTTKDEVRAALIPYKLDEEGRVIRVDKDIIKLDDFRLDMTDEEVISLVSSKLGLKGITRYEE